MYDRYAEQIAFPSRHSHNSSMVASPRTDDNFKPTWASWSTLLGAILRDQFFSFLAMHLINIFFLIPHRLLSALSRARFLTRQPPTISFPGLRFGLVSPHPWSTIPAGFDAAGGTITEPVYCN